ncbi:MAG: helix-turn-helix transcriptional regulator, partial [Actinobacteria bacterium]|nr:helix-turn-helix transcriptional regulator [Actinomycetota bacterium]
QRRRIVSRSQLRLAHQRFEAMGMAAFAERARRELWATGEVVRSEAPTTGPALTAQEEQIAQLATDGLSNPEIGVRLFISARTVEYHLGKVFAKLNISSRAQLADARRVPAGRAARPVE